MSVIDLTGTKWVLNNSIVIDTGFGYSINFASNGSNYASLSFNDARNRMEYGSTYAYDSGWTSQAYRIISITGGTDASDSDLISWLEANATQVPVVDLTGCTWVGNTHLTSFLNNGTECIVNFISNNESFTSIQCPFYFGDYGMLYYFGTNNLPAYSWDDDMGQTISQGTWYNEASRTIEFIDGADISNANLIAWLEANGTLTAPQPQPSSGMSLGNFPIASMHLGAYPISKIYLGNNEIYSGGSVQTISFWIGTQTPTDQQTAESGMTWSQWCNSAYNTGGYTVDLNYGDSGAIMSESWRYVTDGNGNIVDPHDEIVSGYLYQLEGGGGND